MVERVHRLLLQAALRDGDAAIGAWREWLRAVALDEIDPASQRLIPLLARNLHRLGIDHPDRGRMRGIHRYWWSRNQVLLGKLVAVLDAFQAEGIPAMALKGVPLALRYYDDVGLRPMTDFDLLVPTADADRAVATLQARGFFINEPVRVFRRPRRVDVYARPGVGFTGPDDAQCDLHWHMLHDCCWDGADAPFWQHVSTVAWQGHAFPVPDTTDLLLHVIVHGSVFNRMPPIRWIPDAATVMRTAAAEIDWSRLLDEAGRRWLTLVVREGLAEVAALTGTAPPPAVTERLRARAVTRAEQYEYRRRLVDPDYRYTIMGRWCQLSRQYADASPLQRLANTPAFMQQIWAVDRKAVLPLTFAFRIVPAYVVRVFRGSAAPSA